ncbi:MAG: asparagine synthetase B [Chitinivibrionales bacterium]|nr:asparagine synthetase B [Chitinivibrionales bacterium]
MIFIPMDDTQTDHLKSYGLVYKMLEDGNKVYWCLNYRGGSFVAEDSRKFELKARVDGIEIKTISPADWARILETIDNNNMEKVTLEKSPKIAVYTPPNKLPWDDAVTLALTYADIPYNKVYDEEVLGGKLSEYDWLHLHHEDFTGQYSKFYRSFNHTPWYQRQKMELEKRAKKLGFNKVSDCKKAVALAIRNYVDKGGFVFAMCCAPNTFEIALSALGADIVAAQYDGDGIDPNYKNKLNFDNCMGFENFTIQTDPMATYFGNIDVNKVNTPLRIPAADFELFDFSAKLDPVPTMLIQCHQKTVRGFFGLATSYNKEVMKESSVVLGYVPGTKRVKYLHGVYGKGMFAYYGGHDPEDYTHAVGDKPTDLQFHKNSPGYRLILNNVLFPAAEKKEKKT